MSESKRTLLVVDDDPGMRSQLKWGFNNFEVMTADDRMHALEIFNKYRPPIVTLDLGLPPDAEGSQEGFEILRLILDIAPQTYVLIVSGSADIGNAEKAEECGAYRYFAKPVDMTKLSAAVEQAYVAYMARKTKVQQS
jgi:two-component system, NtrC family, response regulator